jgi:ABC-type phosphate transport system substrate-binding protein
VQQHVRVDFDAVGSGEGIERIRRRQVALLADIYQGRIRKWNDAAIGALNPTLALPNVNITVVHRRSVRHDVAVD